MKRFLSLCVALTLVLATFSPVASAVGVDESSETSFYARGTLCDESGNVIANIPLTPVNTYSVQPSDNALSQTLYYEVPYSVLQNSGSSSGWDSYYCIQGTVTINYNLKTDTGEKQMLLTSASGSWTTPNDSRVSVSAASLFCNCSGSGVGSPFYSQTKTFDILNSNGTLCYTNFSNYIYAVEGLAGAVGAKLTITLLMGTSRTWTLNLEYFAFEP